MPVFVKRSIFSGNKRPPMILRVRVKKASISFCVWRRWAKSHRRQSQSNLHNRPPAPHHQPGLFRRKVLRLRLRLQFQRVRLLRRLDQHLEVTRCDDADDAGVRCRRGSPAIESKFKALHYQFRKRFGGW